VEDRPKSQVISLIPSLRVETLVIATFVAFAKDFQKLLLRITEISVRHEFRTIDARFGGPVHPG